MESDRRAMHSTVPSILARVSVELDEEPEFYSADNVMAALAAGKITQADLDELNRRRFVKMFEFGDFDNPYNRFLPTRLRGGRRCGAASGRRGHCSAQE